MLEIKKGYKFHYHEVSLQEDEILIFKGITNKLCLKYGLNKFFYEYCIILINKQYLGNQIQTFLDIFILDNI